MCMRISASLLSEYFTQLADLIEGHLVSDVLHNAALIIRTDSLRKQAELNLEVLRLLAQNFWRIASLCVVARSA